MSKITFIMPSAWPLFCRPPHTPGGAELDLFNIATELAKRNYRCLFLVSHPSGKLTPDPEAQLQESTWKNRVEKIDVFAPLPIIGGVLNTLKLWIVLFQNRPSTLMAKGAGLIVFQVGIWSKITGTRFIWRASHEQNFDPTVIGKRWWYWLYRIGLGWTDQIVCQTDDQLNLLKQNFALNGQVIYNGHLIPLDDQIIPFKSRSGIIWIGRAKTIKQPFLALEIARKFPTHPVTLVVGEGDASIIGEIRYQAKKLSNVTLYENVSLDRTEELLAQSRVMIMTSLREGLPNVLIQALKWQVPVVSLYVNPDQLVTEENGGIFCDGSMDRMIEKVQKLLTNDQYARQLSRAAGQAAGKKFSITSIINYYENII